MIWPRDYIRVTAAVGLVVVLVLIINWLWG